MMREISGQNAAHVVLIIAVVLFVVGVALALLAGRVGVVNDGLVGQMPGPLRNMYRAIAGSGGYTATRWVLYNQIVGSLVAVFAVILATLALLRRT